MISFFEAKGLTCKDTDILKALYNKEREGKYTEISQALYDSIDYSVGYNQPRYPQPLVANLKEKLQLYCINSNYYANYLLGIALREIQGRCNDKHSPLRDTLPVFVATYLLTNMERVEHSSCESHSQHESPVYNIYLNYLLFLFQTLLNRDDVCSWINNIYQDHENVVDTIFRNGSKEEHQILANSRACLKSFGVDGPRNYLFWCGDHVQYSFRTIMIQSRFLDDLVKQLDRDGNSIIHIFTCFGDGSEIDILQYLVTRYPQMLNQKGADGCTPIFSAVKSFNLRAVVLLLNQKNIDLSVKNAKNENIVQTAMRTIAEAYHDELRQKGRKMLTALFSHPQITPCRLNVRFFSAKNQEFKPVSAMDSAKTVHYRIK